MKTVKSSIEIKGHGLMTGAEATVVIEPSDKSEINFFGKNYVFRDAKKTIR